MRESKQTAPALGRILPVLNALAPWLLDALTRRESARVRALIRR